MGKRTKIRGWRKIAAATWKQPVDPQIYGDLEIDAGPILEFIDDVRAASGVRLSVTHIVGKAVAHALSEYPELNVRLYRGHFHRRDTVDIFFIVSAGEGEELSGVKIVRADEKPVVDIARELAERARNIRTGTDEEFGKTKSMMAAVPWRMLKWAFRLAAWITTDRDKDLGHRGLPRQPFGSAMVSSVGMFGIQHAYAPMSPYYRIPFLVLVGEVGDRAVVVDGEIVARPYFTISATLDHRYIDGFHAARLARAARHYLEEPKRFEPVS